MKFTYAAALIASVNASDHLHTRQRYAYNPGFASTYSIPAPEEQERIDSLPEPVVEPTVVEKRCAQVDFNGNYFGIDGILDIELKSNGMVLFEGDFADLTEGDHETYVMSLPVDGDDCDNSGTTFHYIGDAHADDYGDASIYRSRNVSFDDLIGKSVQIRGSYRDYGIRRSSAAPGTGICIDIDNGATDTFDDGCSSYYDNPEAYCGNYDDDDFTASLLCCACGYTPRRLRTRDVQACGNIVENECPGSVQPSTPDI